jgi:hypothetical protein
LPVGWMPEKTRFFMNSSSLRKFSIILKALTRRIDGSAPSC